MHLRLRDVALVLAGIATVGLCIHVATRIPPTPQGATLAASSVASPPPLAETVIDEVVVIGDDVAAVTGHGFPLQLANRTGWQITTDAVDGSGYVALGASGAPGLAARAAAAAARRPDLVILAVGLNDARDFVGDQALRDAARDAFAELTSQPTLVIGPFWPGTASRQAAAVDDLLAAEAAAAGLTYVSPTDERWFSGVASDPRASLRVFLDDDLVRPSAVGSKVLTDRIQEHLDTLASG